MLQRIKYIGGNMKRSLLWQRIKESFAMGSIKIDISQINQVEKILVSRFYETIKVFYENSVNLQRFEQW